MSATVLVVDDEAGIRTSLRGILEDEGWTVREARTLDEGRAAAAKSDVDLVLLDLWLSDGDGMDLLAELHRDRPATPVVVISGHGSVDSAARATRLGAYDFLEKPLSLSRVVLTVQNALERARMGRELEELSSRLSSRRPIIGESPPMHRLREELTLAAGSDSRILIIGENGTGKELVARRIHDLSRRSGGPFVEVNCAAIPEELIESEMFGHVRGAFTGASEDRVGRFELADGGTLFLDEIADMSLKTQAKVLRVLQEQRFERVGGGKTVTVDVRVLAATNKDLETEIAAGRFREDLYFRIAVIPIRVPALRDRSEDVPRLVEHFLRLYGREQGRPPKTMHPDALERLRGWPWPGNVRELRNLVERLVIMTPGPEIEPEHLPSWSERNPGPRRSELPLGPLKEAREEFERRFLQRALARSDGNVTHAAKILDLERTHLHRKLRRLEIDADRFRPGAPEPLSDGDGP